MQKEFTIQELENINFELYKDRPIDLIPVGKNLIASNRLDKAIEVFEFGLKTVIAINNNNEFHIDCAKFNYFYADVLIAKLFEATDLFNNENLPAEEERKETKENSDTKENNNVVSEGPEKDEKIIEDVQNNNINNINVDEEKDDEGENEEDDEDDEKIAFEHLAVAEKTLKGFLEKYDNTAENELPPKIIIYYLDLSDVYFKFGELELIKSDFKLALEFFNQSLKYKKKYDSKYSRAIAEIYFMMASACDADAKQALFYYYKTYLILYFHVRKENKLEPIEFNVDFETISHEEIIINKELIQLKDDDNEKVKGLKETLNDVVVKIEDVIEEVKLCHNLVQEKMNLNKNQESGFNTNYDEKNIIDITKIGVVKKKVREQFTQYDILNGNTDELKNVKYNICTPENDVNLSENSSKIIINNENSKN